MQRSFLLTTLSMLGIFLAGCGSSPETSSTATPPAISSHPEQTKESTSPATPCPRAAGDVLYEADWSSGMDGWAGSQDWKHVGGMLVNDGSNRRNEWISAPCQPGTRDYATEAEIQLIDPVKCGFNIHQFGLIARAEEEGGILGGLDCYDTNGMVIASTERGKFSFNDSIASKDFTLDQDWHVYRLEVQGNNIRLLVDGTPLLEGADNRHLDAGKVGMFSVGAQINVQSFKIMKV